MQKPEINPSIPLRIDGARSWASFGTGTGLTKGQSQAIKSRKSKSKLKVFSFSLCILIGSFWIYPAFGQDDILEFTLESNSSTVPTPRIFKPSIDISGYGLVRDNHWPSGLADKEMLDAWKADIGFNGMYRLQYNLWEIGELAKEKEIYDATLAYYDGIIKTISDAGGIVILDIFGTPAGLGKVLDKKSPPADFKKFKALVKSHMRTFSCLRRYTVWYEVWSAPDLDDFFLGRKQEYLNTYKAVAEAAKELEAETKIHIPVGGPATSWWFQNLGGNSLVTAERSLIYELIKFCYRYRLPLDFVSWHAYTADPKNEAALTVYKKKNAVSLIRDWLVYFHRDKNIPLVIDEWNYDDGNNLSPARGEKAHIGASYIPARLKAMYEARLDGAVYYCLEDFQNGPAGVMRNVGVFRFDSASSAQKILAKPLYNAFRMLAALGNTMFLSASKLDDEFVSVLATRDQERLALLVSNYIDPEIAGNYISRNIGTLRDGERKILLNLARNEKLGKILRGELDISRVNLTRQLRALFKKAIELKKQGEKFSAVPRVLKLTIKGLEEHYVYQRLTLDSSCSMNCAFTPSEAKTLSGSDTYQESLSLQPYSLQLVVIKKKPKEPVESAPAASNQTQEEIATAPANHTTVSTP